MCCPKSSKSEVQEVGTKAKAPMLFTNWFISHKQVLALVQITIAIYTEHAQMVDTILSTLKVVRVWSN